MLEGVTVAEGAKDELVISGNDIENVSQSAASITDKCRVKEKDVSTAEIHCFGLVTQLLLAFPRSESSWTESTLQSVVTLSRRHSKRLSTPFLIVHVRTS
jgi:hypothetical protein